MLYTIITNILILVMVLSGPLAVTLFPWKFNESIIPEIERKIGKKLEWSKSYETAFNPLGTFGSKVVCGYFEIMYYIATKYVLSKFGKDKPYFRIFKFAALYKANYQTEQFSRREIVWSILGVLNLWYLVFGAIFLTLGQH